MIIVKLMVVIRVKIKYQCNKKGYKSTSPHPHPIVGFSHIDNLLFMSAMISNNF
jgi:hypothetical protein